MGRRDRASKVTKGSASTTQENWSAVSLKFSALPPPEVGALRPAGTVIACAQEYRSFRSSDCTYQPYRGGRRLCEIAPEPSEMPLLAERRLLPDRVEALALVDPRQSEEREGSARSAVTACDVQTCAAEYRSFRASDCTYQPYGGGPRRMCDKGLEAPGEVVSAEPLELGAAPPAHSSSPPPTYQEQASNPGHTAPPAAGISPQRLQPVPKQHIGVERRPVEQQYSLIGRVPAETLLVISFSASPA